MEKKVQEKFEQPESATLDGSRPRPASRGTDPLDGSVKKKGAKEH